MNSVYTKSYFPHDDRRVFAWCVFNLMGGVGYYNHLDSIEKEINLLEIPWKR